MFIDLISAELTESVQSVSCMEADSFFAPEFYWCGTRYLGWMWLIKCYSIEAWEQMRLHWAHLTPIKVLIGDFMTDLIELPSFQLSFYGVVSMVKGDVKEWYFWEVDNSIKPINKIYLLLRTNKIYYPLDNICAKGKLYIKSFSNLVNTLSFESYQFCKLNILSSKALLIRSMRPNYNYNYNYKASPSNLQKPSSFNSYLQSKPYQPNLLPNSPSHDFVTTQPVKYYPINHDQTHPLKTLCSLNQPLRSFLIQTKTSQNQFLSNPNQFTSLKSPKSSQNWYPSNNTSRIYINPNDPQKSGLSPIRKSQMADSTIQNYINWLHQAFQQFEQSGNVKILKEINEKNSSEIKKIYQELKGEKENIQKIQSMPKSSKQVRFEADPSPRAKNPLDSQKIYKLKQQLSVLGKESSNITNLIRKQSIIAEQLKKQLQEQIQFKENKNLNLNQSQIRQDNHMKQMQQSIVELEEEIKTLQRKNNELSKGMIHLPFFKQWNIMFEEAKGATKLNLKLKNQVLKRQQLIKELTNQDPSNNSDARSIRRVPSQSGQRPSNFKKEQNTTNPSNPLITSKARPQLAHKFEKQDPGHLNDVIIRHLSHSNRFSQSKKSTVNNSVDKTRQRQRKQSYDQKPYTENDQWKGMSFHQNIKSFGLNFIAKDAKK